MDRDEETGSVFLEPFPLIAEACIVATLLLLLTTI